MLIYAIHYTLSLFTQYYTHSGTFNQHQRSFLSKMHMFPLGRVVYMPLSTSTTTTAGTTTTLLGPVPTDFSSPTIPFYNTALLGNPFNLCTTTKCKFPFFSPLFLSKSSNLYRLEYEKAKYFTQYA